MGFSWTRKADGLSIITAQFIEIVEYHGKY